MDILNPLEYPGWDDLLLATKDSSLFHTSFWAQVLQETYNYRPCYATTIESGKLISLVPLMDVNSFLTGRRGVSLPFTDYCEPIIAEGDALEDVINRLIPFARKSFWKYLELRTVGAQDEELPPSSSYVGHRLNLGEDEQAVFSQFRESTQRNIRKAQKTGVHAIARESAASLYEFYRLHCMTRKMHGLPPQPRRFFEKIHEHIIARGHGMVVLAEYKGSVIAGAVYLHFGDRAVYKFGASDMRYRHLRANNLVMWEAIRRYAQHGCKELLFGRTEPDNAGLLQFKRGWGADEYPIVYYRYDLEQNAYVPYRSKLEGFHNKVFGAMPVPLLKLAGSLLYRHMG